MLQVLEGTHKVSRKALSLGFPFIAFNFRALDSLLQCCHVLLELLDLSPQDSIVIICLSRGIL